MAKARGHSCSVSIRSDLGLARSVGHLRLALTPSRNRGLKPVGSARDERAPTRRQEAWRLIVKKLYLRFCALSSKIPRPPNPDARETQRPGRCVQPPCGCVRGWPVFGPLPWAGAATPLRADEIREASLRAGLLTHSLLEVSGEPAYDGVTGQCNQAEALGVILPSSGRPFRSLALGGILVCFSPLPALAQKPKTLRLASGPRH